MKINRGKYVCGFFLLSAVMTTTAQSIWNYIISDAGGGSSLVTWNVTGSLTNIPGITLLTSRSSLPMPISAPGIYNDFFTANGAGQGIPTADGSYYQLGGGQIYLSIVGYHAFNAPGGGNDSFDLSTGQLPPHMLDPGSQVSYHSGTESVLIPIDYANFNPGTYQSQVTGFNTPVTVNLTVGSVPEPSTLTLSALGGLSGLLLFCRRK